jgi:hypothetical protein
MHYAHLLFHNFWTIESTVIEFQMIIFVFVN